MRVIYRKIEMTSRSDEYDLRLIGDSHYGTIACDVDLLRHDFKDIGAVTCGGWIGMGDYFEAILPNDIRHDGRTIDPDVMSRAKNSYGKFVNLCVQDMADIMQPAAHNCIGLLSGNHEETINTRYHHDMVGQLLGQLHAKNLTIEDLTYEAVIILTFSRKTGKTKQPTRNVILYVWHGAGGGTTRGGRINRREKMRQTIPDADLYATGHFHEKAQYPEYPMRVVISEDNPHLLQREQWFLGVPSFYRTYVEGISTYASKMGYPPSGLGHNRVIIRPFATKTIGGVQFDMPDIKPQW